MDYLIKWKNEGPKSNSWVRKDLMDAPDALDKFLKERVDFIVTDCPPATIIIRADLQEPEGLPPIWKYLVRPASDPQYGPATET